MSCVSEPIPAAWRWLIGAVCAAPVPLGMAYYVGSPALNRWLWSEQGPLEISHVLIPLAAAITAVATLGSRQRMSEIRRAGLGWLAVSIGGVALVCGMIAGEEASWGQHFLGWPTPESWSALNDQGETNLHNLGHNLGPWVDQKPRALVELSVILFGIVWPLVDRLTTMAVRPTWRLILPPVALWPVALFAEGVRLFERVPHWLGTAASPVFPRPSELQELYFYTFLALCLLSWRRRLLDRLVEDADAVLIRRIDQPVTQRRAA